MPFSIKSKKPKYASKTFWKNVDFIIKTGLNKIKSYTKKIGEYVDIAKLVVKFGNSIVLDKETIGFEQFKQTYLDYLSGMPLEYTEILARQEVLKEMQKVLYLDYIAKKFPKFFEEVLNVVSKGVSERIRQVNPNLKEDIDALKVSKEILYEFDQVIGEARYVLINEYGKTIIPKVYKQSRKVKDPELYKQVLEEKVTEIFRNAGAFNNIASKDVELLVKEIVESAVEAEKEAQKEIPHLSIRYGDDIVERRRIRNKEMLEEGFFTDLVATFLFVRNIVRVVNNVTKEDIDTLIIILEKMKNSLSELSRELEKMERLDY
jgi:hypothetical protein